MKSTMMNNLKIQTVHIVKTIREYHKIDLQIATTIMPTQLPIVVIIQYNLKKTVVSKMSIITFHTLKDMIAIVIIIILVIQMLVKSNIVNIIMSNTITVKRMFSIQLVNKET